MLDIYQNIKPWIANRKPFALATVVQSRGTTPRGLGSAMAITADFEVAGSVSGGCVEGAIIEEAQTVLRTNIPCQVDFGVESDAAWSAGLSCGGEISVFIEPHFSSSPRPDERIIWRTLQKSIEKNEPVVLLTRMSKQNHCHLLVRTNGQKVGDWQELNKSARAQALACFKSQRNEQVMLGAEPIFVQYYFRKERLVVIGATHIALHLVTFARELGFEVIVIDPRKVFAEKSRFQVPPDKIITRWPAEVLPKMDLTEDTSAVLLTHDPKIDDQALHILLHSRVRYIGALGSRKTHAQRIVRLREAGFATKQIDRIHSPAGLHIHAGSPGEIALSVMAEIVKIKDGK